MRMESHLNFMDFGIWNSFVEGYTPSSTPLITPDETKAHLNNGKARNAIISGLFDNELLKVMD